MTATRTGPTSENDRKRRAFGDVPGRREAARKAFLTLSSIAQLVTSPASRRLATRLRMPAPGQRRPLGALPGCVGRSRLAVVLGRTMKRASVSSTGPGRREAAGHQRQTKISHTLATPNNHAPAAARAAMVWCPLQFAI